MLEKFLSALNEGKEYDFISNNYQNITNVDIKTILLEYIYALKFISDTDKEKVYDSIKENLEGML